MLPTQVCVFALYLVLGLYFWYFVEKVEEVEFPIATYDRPDDVPPVPPVKDYNFYDEVAPDEPAEDYLVPWDLPFNPYENIDAIYSEICADSSGDSSFSWESRDGSECG
jgi:hypothetical protein